MLATYTGRVRNGQPVIFEEVTLPENAGLIIMILDESLSAKTPARNQKVLLDDEQAHRVAFDEFFAAIAAIDDEPITDDELVDFEQNRVNWKQ